MNVEKARAQMIEQQIRAWEVLDAQVLEVLSQVPRENFVPGPYRSLAFADTQLPLAHGQVMMAPNVEGRMLQALGIQAGDSVLEIGTGSGFVTACLARLAGQVVSLEHFADMTEAAATRLAGVGIKNVTLETIDANQFDSQKRFDAIAVTASIPLYRNQFQNLLSPGGRLFVITGTAPLMEVWLITRVGDNDFSHESLFETLLAPMINCLQPEQFVL